MKKYYSLVVLLFVFTISLSAQNWSETNFITNPTPENYDRFGRSTAISGNTAVVGAPYDDADVTNSNKGVVYIYELNNGNWSLSTSFTPLDVNTGDEFGYSVAIDGNTIVIGTRLSDAGSYNTGAAYIYEKINNTWTQTAKLSASDSQQNDYFGHNVAIDGDTIVVGAYASDDNGYSSGSAYIFERNNNNWTETSKITASDAAQYDYFGWTVDIDNDVVVVGSRGNDDNGTNSGSAYIFEKNNNSWSQTSKITALDAAQYANFGYTVSINNGNIVVGAYYSNGNVANSGSAYVFSKSNNVWQQTQKLVASDSERGDGFGLHTDIEGDTIIISAYADDTNGVYDTGSVYVFNFSNNTWSETQKIAPASLNQYDYVGLYPQLSISNSNIIFGVDRRDINNFRDAGAIYFYSNGQNVQDTTPPVITLVGDNPQNIEFGDPYTELNAVALDDTDGDISANITIDASNVNVNALGSYSVTYNVIDNAQNNAVEVVRTVNVVDTTVPVISLIGDENIIIEENTNYTELGATASDNIDGDISNNITIDNSTLDTTTPGIYSITYNVSDNSGNAAVQVTRTVNVLSSIPTTQNDTATVDENSNNNIIDVLSNDSFGIQGPNATHPLTFANGALTNASVNGGEVSIHDNGTPNDLTDDVIVYTPATDFYGEDTITYVITDALGIAQTATVTVTVISLPTMSTPTATADVFSVDSYSENNILNVLNNDEPGLDGYIIGGLTFTNGTLNSATSSGGIISVNNNNTDTTSDDTISYNAPTNFTGVDTFQYTITDASGDASTTTVTINVLPSGTLTATDDTVFVEQDSSDNAVEVLINDNFGVNDRANADYLTTSGTSTEGGTITVQGDQLLYTPATGFNGDDIFTYTLKDGLGQTVQAIVNVVVKAEDFINDIPTAEDDSATVIQNGTVNIDVLINDSFGDEGPTTKHMPLTTNKGWNTQVTQQGGLITMIDNTDSNDPNHIPNLQPCFINYTPAPGFVGVDTFEYVITDASGDAATATVTVTVQEDTTLTTLVADSFTVNENSTNNNIDILANDEFGSQVLLRRLIITNTTTSQGGSIVVNNNFSRNPLDFDILYTPNANFTGEDTFTYTLETATGTPDPITVTINVEAVVPTNVTPTAKDDAITVAANSTNVVIDVLSDNGNGADDFGTDGAMNGGLTFTNGTLNSASTNDGLISVDNKGTEDTSDDVILYNAPANFSGVDTFQYTITDASGDASSATVTITVGSITEITTVNDTATTNVNTPVDIDYMANDIGINNADGSFNIIITGFSFSSPVNGGTVNFIDGGVLSINDDRLLYTPANNFVGEDSFTYTLTYGNGQSATGTVTVTVISTDTNNGIPTAVDDAITVNQDSTNNLLDVLDNDDYGLDGANATHPLTFTNGSLVNASIQGGAISIVDDNGTNKISYTPVPGFSGEDTITYLITDASGDAASASVTVTVTSNGTNAIPTAVDDVATVAISSASNSIDVLDNDTPGTDGYINGGLTFTNGTLNSASSNGALISIDDKGTFTTSDDEIVYNAPKGFTGIDSFQYTITDATGDASSATVTITVGAPNTITAFDDEINVSENSSNNVIDIFDNDFGVRNQDGSPNVTIESIAYGNTSNGGAISQVDGGVLSFNDDHISYTPSANYNGIETFTYTITYDNGTKTTSATVTINVVANVTANGTPTATDDTFGENEGFDRYNWNSTDPIIYLNVLANDDFGIDGPMTAHNALNLINGKIDELSAEGRRIRIDDNGTPLDYSDDRIAYYATSNTNITSDSFTYYITDNSGDATSATVTINYFDTASPKIGEDVDTGIINTSNGANGVLNNEFIAYPNPSKGNLNTVIFSNQKRIVTLSLFDIKGTEVYRTEVKLKSGKNQLNYNFNVKAGVMFLRVTSGDLSYGIKKIVFK